MMKDLITIVKIPLVIFPIIYFLFYLFSQGHFTH